VDKNNFARIEKLIKAKSGDVDRWIRLQGEEFQQKLDLVIEG